MRIAWTPLETPIGRLALAATDRGLYAVGLPGNAPDEDWEEDAATLAPYVAWFEQYFAGSRDPFELPLHPLGTAFQREVWQALLNVPHGETTSYGQLARDLGRHVGAARAVGRANATNPRPIAVPCHRVIGDGGALTGFAGGLPTKAWLLQHETPTAQLTLWD